MEDIDKEIHRMETEDTIATCVVFLITSMSFLYMLFDWALH